MCWQIEWPALCPRVRDAPVQLNLLISRHIPFVLSPPQIGQAGSVRSNIHEAGSVFRYWGVKGLRVLCIFWFFIFGLFISQFNMFNFGWYIFNFWWYLVRFYISSFIMFTFWWYLLSFWWYLMRFYISNSILNHEGHQPIQLFYLSNLPLKWRIRYQWRIQILGLKKSNIYGDIGLVGNGVITTEAFLCRLYPKNKHMKTTQGSSLVCWFLWRRTKATHLKF
jgi:hypothetical protein